MKQRLFIAIELPDYLKQQIQAVLPATRPGLRPVLSDQLHITLHFLGEIEQQPVVAALNRLHVTHFRLSLAGAGCFNSHGKTVCWMGVNPCVELSNLHARIARELLSCGYMAEVRAYKPHVTVFRAKQSLAKHVVTDALEQLRRMTADEFEVEEICLYSSQLGKDGPRYHIERRFR